MKKDVKRKKSKKRGLHLYFKLAIVVIIAVIIFIVGFNVAKGRANKENPVQVNQNTAFTDYDKLPKNEPEVTEEPESPMTRVAPVDEYTIKTSKKYKYAPESKKIALTFDDGPSEYTPQLLDILGQYNAKATFLLIGTQVEKYGDILPRMKSEGHVIGSHSYSHLEMLDQPAEVVLDEFNKTDKVITDRIGEGAEVVRFPYGDYTKELTAMVGKPNLLWDVDSLDWDYRNADLIINEVYEYLQPGTIILFHDIYPETIDAVSRLVPQLIEQGYELVTIEELAGSRGYDLEGGVTYFSFKNRNINENRVNDLAQ